MTLYPIEFINNSHYLTSITAQKINKHSVRIQDESKNSFYNQQISLFSLKFDQTFLLSGIQA